MAYPMSTKTTKDHITGGGGAPTSGPAGKSGGGSWLKGLVTLIVILVIIGGGIYLIASYTGIGSGLFNPNQLSGNWQAVFLSNGQVYFGKVSNAKSKYVELTDAYYFQLKDASTGQSAGEGATIQTNPQAPAGQNKGEMTLVKLGSELHGPEDKMMINQSQILFIEDLRSDSKVVQAIEGNQSK